MLSRFVAPPVGTRSSSPNILKIVTVSFPFEYLTIFSLAHIRNTAVARRNEDIHCKRWLALPAPFPVWTKQMPDNITLGERFWRWWCWYDGLVWCCWARRSWSCGLQWSHERAALVTSVWGNESGFVAIISLSATDFFMIRPARSFHANERSVERVNILQNMRYNARKDAYRACTIVRLDVSKEQSSWFRDVDHALWFEGKMYYRR